MMAGELSVGPIPVIGHGPGWLVIEKPSGMSVHNDPTGDLCTMLKNILQSDQELAIKLDPDPAYGLHAVHRLDKETSGIILLACRREVFQHFSGQFAQGNVTKTYLALVHGKIGPTVDKGQWRWPLTPKAAGRRNIQGPGKRSQCLTQYRVLESSPHYTLLACRPLTGRTHQIRRHAALDGHPIVGDRRYGSSRACRYVAEHHSFTRLALHADTLGVSPPDSDGMQTFQSAGLPEVIRALIERDQTTD